MKANRMTPFRPALLGLALFASTQAFAADVTRYPLPGGSKFPISLGVAVPAGKKIVFVSGMGAEIADKAAKPMSLAAYGDTKTQTISTFEQIKSALKVMNLEMKDVIKMQVFLVGDPAKEGKMDFAGFMAGYTQYFGGDKNPNLPSRSALQVAALANPGWLVEIEVTAVAPE
jgi:enamine deaminase RidA (YjgF/YER057c/UK114 family)